MGHYGIQILSKIRNIRVAAGFAIAIVIAAFVKKLPWVEAHELGVVDTICQIIIVFCAAVLIVVYAKSIAERVYRIKSMLLMFGDYSYEIYLTHSVYIEMLKNVAEKIIREKLLVILIYIGLTFVSTVILRGLMRHMNKVYQRKAT